MKKYFKTFMLANGVADKSISSYFSYVKGTYEKFAKKDFKKYPTIYDRLLVLTKRSRVMYCEYLISLLKAELQHPYSHYSKKTLTNYKSGMVMLKRFVDSGVFPLNGKSYYNKVFAVSYTPDEIIDNFIFRLETQDRIYPKFKNCFPCRLLGKIYSAHPLYHKKYADMMAKCLNKTKFLVNSNKDYVTLEQIDRLDIVGGIKVWCGGNSYDVFTEVIKKKSFMGCVKTVARLLEDLALDHDEPLENIVNREISGLPELKKLSDAYWNYYITTGLEGSRLTTSFYSTEYKKLGIDEARLLDDVIEVYRYVEFSMMEGRYNSALGNSIIATPPLGTNVG